MAARSSKLDSAQQWDSESQRRFWNDWDMQYLQEDTIGAEALRRGEVVLGLLRSLGLQRPRILEIGCGNGWLAEHFQQIGPVTGVDIANVAIAAARRRVPEAEFVAADILHSAFRDGCFDVVVALETLSHVADQRRFVEIAANALSKKGHLILATQNRTVYLRKSHIRPPAEGQLRRWVTRAELRTFLSPFFNCLQLITTEPSGDMGFLRIINSPKLNAALRRVLPQERIRRLKECLGCGQTIIVLAEKLG
jgi:SAM-dependent methyltransferase